MALETFRRKEDFIDSEEFDDPTYQKQLIQLVLTAMKTRKDPFLVNLHRMLFKEQQNLSTMQQLYEFLIKETAAIIAMQTQILAFHGISTFTIGKEDKTMSSVTNKSDKREKKDKNGGKAPPSNLPQKQYCNYCNNLHHAKHGKVSCFYKVHRHPDINPSGQWEGSKAAEKWLKIGSDPNRPGGSHIIRGKLANGNPWDPEKPQEGELTDFSELPFHIHEKNDKIYENVTYIYHQLNTLDYKYNLMTPCHIIQHRVGEKARTRPINVLVDNGALEASYVSLEMAKILINKYDAITIDAPQSQVTNALKGSKPLHTKGKISFTLKIFNELTQNKQNIEIDAYIIDITFPIIIGRPHIVKYGLFKIMYNQILYGVKQDILLDDTQSVYDMQHIVNHTINFMNDNIQNVSCDTLTPDQCYGRPLNVSQQPFYIPHKIYQEQIKSMQNINTLLQHELTIDESMEAIINYTKSYHFEPEHTINLLLKAQQNIRNNEHDYQFDQLSALQKSTVSTFLTKSRLDQRCHILSSSLSFFCGISAPFMVISNDFLALWPISSFLLSMGMEEFSLRNFKKFLKLSGSRVSKCTLAVV